VINDFAFHSRRTRLLFFSPSYSIFVGDLDSSVTDDKLEDFFLKRYRSVKGAKIMYEEGGVSRWFNGFEKQYSACFCCGLLT